MSRDFLRSELREFIQSAARDRRTTIPELPDNPFRFHGGVLGRPIADGSIYESIWDHPDWMNPIHFVDGVIAFGGGAPAQSFDGVSPTIPSILEPGQAGEIIKYGIRVAGICELYNPKSAVVDLHSEFDWSPGPGQPTRHYSVDYINRGTVFYIRLPLAGDITPPGDLLAGHRYEPLPGSSETNPFLSLPWEVQQVPTLILNSGGGSGLSKIEKQVFFTKRYTNSVSQNGRIEQIFFGGGSFNRPFDIKVDGVQSSPGAVAACLRNLNDFDTLNPINVPPSGNIFIGSPTTGRLLYQGQFYNRTEMQWIWGKFNFVQRNYPQMEEPVYSDVSAPVQVN
jgi:hypothetical protein